MTGILGKFYVEYDLHGAKVTARSQQLTSSCMSEEEIETAIQMLKDDLDACANEMKRLIKLNRAPLFAGWPTNID
ncbi:MAG TPA: hypothetical protein VGU01_14540 [Sphingomicrobium sp.]|nr:hypothetical protein [Sphingomicrobium sp.]